MNSVKAHISAIIDVGLYDDVHRLIWTYDKTSDDAYRAGMWDACGVYSDAMVAAQKNL